MKVELIFTDVHKGEKFKKTVEFDIVCLIDLLTDKALKKIFNEEIKIQKKNRKIIFLTGIKDADFTSLN